MSTKPSLTIRHERLAVVISVNDFLLFCNRTLDGYERAMSRLDDASVNAVPSTGGSTPFQLVTHAIAATNWWTAHHVCGHQVARNRDAEFEAAGPLADAAATVAEFRTTLAGLAPEMAAAVGVHGAPSTQTPLGQDWTIGACLIHAYEELAQHLGHLELTTDLVAD